MCESVCLSLFVAVVAPTKKGRKKKKKKCHTFIFDFRFFLVPGGCSKNVKIIPFSTANHTNRAERCINAATRGSPGFYVMQTRCSLHVQRKLEVVCMFMFCICTCKLPRVCIWLSSRIFSRKGDFSATFRIGFYWTFRIDKMRSETSPKKNEIRNVYRSTWNVGIGNSRGRGMFD
jgi:hypothetical protein